MTSASLALWGLLVASAGARPGLALSSPGPEPADVVRTPPPELVTPGTIGFLVTFGVAVALVLLVRDMVRRNRGLVVRAERRDAELRARAEAEGRDGGTAGGPGSPDGVPGGDGAAPGGTRPPRPGTARDRDVLDGQGPAAPNG